MSIRFFTLSILIAVAAPVGAAHLRYDNGCSGWVADGGTAGDDGSSAHCGASPVPEPSAALVFCAGALAVGGALRRRR